MIRDQLGEAVEEQPVGDRGEAPRAQVDEAPHLEQEGRRGPCAHGLMEAHVQFGHRALIIRRRRAGHVRDDAPQGVEILGRQAHDSSPDSAALDDSTHMVDLTRFRDGHIRSERPPVRMADHQALQAQALQCFAHGPLAHAHAARNVILDQLHPGRNGAMQQLLAKTPVDLVGQQALLRHPDLDLTESAVILSPLRSPHGLIPSVPTRRCPGRKRVDHAGLGIQKPHPQDAGPDQRQDTGR